jgi:peptidoglycan/xylan/chitin deacetylase (PgdA/CDA1 family)
VRINVLLYHDVVHGRDSDASGFAGHGPDRYKLDWGRFVEHLDALEQATPGPPVALDGVLGGRAQPGAWAITFDDGGASALAAGAELGRRGWRAHFFCVSDRIGRRGFLGPDEIIALERMGHPIGSHSRTHPPRITDCSWSEMVDEWRSSTERLAALLGHPVTSAAVPGGFYSAALARAAAAARISLLFTSEPVRTVRRVDGCLVIGRHAIRHHTRPETAAAVAAGHRSPWLRQRAGWTARKAAKGIGGDAYLKARAALLSRR